MKKGLNGLLSAIVLFVIVAASAENAFAVGGVVTGRFMAEEEPLRCAVFAYLADRMPFSPYSEPFRAAGCEEDGSFSLTLPEGTYLISNGISLAGKFWAIQPDPSRRIPLEGPYAQKIVIVNGGSYEIPRFDGPGKGQLEVGRGMSATQNQPGPNVRRIAPLNLTGKVLDGNGRPVPYSVVQVFRSPAMGTATSTANFLSTPTDKNGDYRIEGVPPLSYVIMAFKLDTQHGPLTGSARVRTDETEVIDLSDPKTPLTFNIVVQSPTSATPISNERSIDKPKKPVRSPSTDPSSL